MAWFKSKVVYVLSPEVSGCSRGKPEVAWFKPKVVYGLSSEVAVVVVEESPRWLGLSPRWFMFLTLRWQWL